MEYLERVTWTPENWAAFVFGIIVVLLFSVSEFPKKTFSPFEGWPEDPFALSDLTTRQRYITSFIFYLFGLEFVYVVICIMGPAPFAALTPPTSGFTEEGTFPLWVALALVGVVPRLPYFKEMEIRWRQLMHQRAAIPGVAMRLSDRMKRSSHDFLRLKKYIDEKQQPYFDYVTGEEIAAPSGTSRHYFARLSANLLEINIIERGSRIHDDKSVPDHMVDFQIFKKYNTEIENIESRYYQIGEGIKNARTTATGFDPSVLDPNAVDDFCDKAKDEIEKLFEKTCILISCAILSKRTDTSGQELALKELGIIGDHESTNSIRNRFFNETEIISQGFFLGVALYFLFTIIAPYALIVLPDTFGGASGWPDKVNTTVSLQWSGAILFTHGAALVAGIGLRERMLRNHRWFTIAAGNFTTPSFFRYTYVCLVAILAAAFFYFIWTAIWRSLDVAINELYLSSAFCVVAGSTAFFAIKFLDVRSVRRSFKFAFAWLITFILIECGLQILASLHYYGERESSRIGAISFGAFSLSIFAASIGAWVLFVGKRKKVAGDPN